MQNHNIFIVSDFILMLVFVGALESDTGLDLTHNGGFNTFKFGAKPSDKKCHDFCSLMSGLCRNGGSCVLDENTCVASCVCAPGWVGRWCREEASVADQDTIDNFTVTIGPSLETADPTKVKGDMEKSDKASDDVMGLLTRTFVNKTKLFEIHTSKMIDQEKEMAITGELIKDTKVNVSKEMGTVITMRPKSDDVSDCLNTCNDGDCIAKNGEYICTRRIDVSKLKGPKTCQPGFVCQHGVCDMNTKDKGLKCICEPSYIGTFCEMKCPFDCGEHGVCDYHVDDNQLKCFCQWNYTGLNCTELIPLPPGEVPVIFHWYVVGISVAIVTLVLGILAFLPYWMWKRRLVFILKIVHYFQQYEEDDGREYDAFISYKSTPADEKFVLQFLHPKLETELRFKLCLHFRDFLPGEAIANNIVKAIENSRRTIMILSPAYVNSEWCRMEYQKAQHEMLKLKHRIIPIVLEDISNCKNIDKNLKGILNSVTYIEWPGEENSKRLERFWKKIQLSLPKKSSTLKNISSPSLHTCSSAPAVMTSNVDSQPDSEIQELPNDIETTGTNCTSETSSDAASLDSGRRSPRFRKNKKKDFKHFVDKLVRGKLFVRQDSTSSQTVLVDEETAYSKASYDSVSESMFTESTDSACSTPVTAHSYLNGDTDKNAFFCSDECNVNCAREINKEKQNDICEKDHCDFSTCTSCSELANSINKNTNSPQEYDNEGFCESNYLEKLSCRKCKVMKEGADNNIVKISPVDGSDMLKIQKLSGERYLCDKCSEKIELTHTESEKRRKDEENMKLLQQRRATPSLSHRRTASQKGITLNVRDLQRHTSSENDVEIFIDVCENV